MKFEEAKRFKTACIYCLTYPDGKQYVGQTKNLCSRINLYERQCCDYLDKSTPSLIALREAGIDNIELDVLRSFEMKDCDDLSLCLSILEIKYIRALNTLSPNGYNVSFGGEYLNIPPEYINTSGRHGGSGQCVLVYDSGGNFLKKYLSKAQCCYDLGILDKELPSYLDKSKIYNGKYIFRSYHYDYIPEHIESTGFKVVTKVKTVVKREIVKREFVVNTYPHALKYDSSGKFCGEYESKARAALTFSKSHGVPYGKYVNGFVLYKKVSDDYPMQIEPYEETVGKILGDVYKPMSECEDKPLQAALSKPSWYKKKDKLHNDFEINQYDLYGNFIAKHDGIRSASKSTGVRYSCIWQNIKGRTKQGGGYIWKKVDE